MNNTVVMTAISERMTALFKIYTNPLNEGKPALAKISAEIADLYEAYFELRGCTGSAGGFAGLDSEVNNVKSIYELTR